MRISPTLLTCLGLVLTTLAGCDPAKADVDADGVVAAIDCDDTNAELGDVANDSDCDGAITSEDCDDNNASLGASDLDQDCDGALSTEDCDDADPFMNLEDADEDGSSSCDGDCNDNDATLNLLDGDGDGYSSCSGDCDDTDPNAATGKASREPSLCTRDLDADGWGDASADAPLEAGSDCDDSDNTVYPGAASQEPSLCTRDADGDGYGDPTLTSPADPGTDCDDSDALKTPVDLDGDGYTGCDGDCDDGNTALNLDDYDADGFTSCDGDCDDTDEDLELLDRDSDGFTTCDGDCDDRDPDLELTDHDSDGVTTCDGDCDDFDSTVTNCSDGTARMTDGTWIDVNYEVCGSSGCTAQDAKNACTAVGMKVVSHASDGNSQVHSLGASLSCQWSVSYYTVDAQMNSNECLVGISNLDWSDCCTTARWHGNTIPFGQPSSVFGYVYSSNSGYTSSYTNSSGSSWGCNDLSSPSSTYGSCSTYYVACTP